MRQLKTFALVVTLLFLTAPGVGATPVTVTYQGGVFGLELLSSAGNVHTVKYTADLQNFVPGDKAYITAVAFKLGPDPSAATILSTNAFGNWYTALDSWMNNSGYGCNSSSAKAICAQVLPAETSYYLNPTNAFYYWTFQVTVGGGEVSVNLQPIRADFVDLDGESAGQLSMTTPGVIPEPATLLLLGSGLASAGLLRRRRK